MSTTTEANKKVIERFNELLGVGDLEGAYALTTEDLSWFSLSGRKTFGRQELKEVTKWVLKAALREPVKLTTLETTAEDDRVAVMANGRAVTIDGVEYNNMYHMLYKFRDGKICAAWEFNDTYYSRQTIRRGNDGELGLGEALAGLSFSTKT